MRGLIINPQNSDTWKIYFKIAINFISSKDIEGECSKRNNIEFMPDDNANEVVDELFKSLLSRC